MSTFSKARIGKIPVDRIALEDMLRSLTNAIRSRTPKTVFYANSYAVTLAEEDPAFAAAMGNLLLVVGLICLALQAKFLRRSGGKS